MSGMNPCRAGATEFQPRSLPEGQTHSTFAWLEIEGPGPECRGGFGEQTQTALQKEDLQTLQTLSVCLHETDVQLMEAGQENSGIKRSFKFRSRWVPDRSWRTST